MRLISNQVRIYRHALANFRRLLASSYHTATVDYKQMKVSRRISKNLVHNILHKPQIVEELESSVFLAEPVRISFVAATRRLDNPNHRLHHFLQSVVTHAKDPSRVEVLLAIDSDDDIEHYLSLKRRYGNRLR